MAATLAMVERLRRMTNESLSQDFTYALMAEAIERYPVADEDSNEPADSDWTATYDLYAAASDIWTEKAAAVAQDYNFSANDAGFDRSQVYAQYMRMARYYASRRNIGSIRVSVSPKPSSLTGEL